MSESWKRDAEVSRLNREISLGSSVFVRVILESELTGHSPVRLILSDQTWSSSNFRVTEGRRISYQRSGSFPLILKHRNERITDDNPLRESVRKRDRILTFVPRYQKVQHLFRLQGPYTSYRFPQLLVRLVPFVGCEKKFSQLRLRAEKNQKNRPSLTASHLDAKILADQSEQRGGEVHLPFVIHRHVHPDELLVGEPIRALITKPQRRVHVLEHFVHLPVMDLAGRVRIVFRPDANELVQVVSTQDRRVSRKVIEIVHDDGDEEVQHEERTEENEGDEVSVRDVRATASWFLFAGLHVAGTTLDAGQHDVRPSFAGRAPGNIILVHSFFLQSFDRLNRMCWRNLKAAARQTSERNRRLEEPLFT